VIRRVVDIAAVAAIVLVAAWLRMVHVGTPSLWWDELVEIRTAERPLAHVVREVRLGAGINSGNAGAMPGDYLLLSTYLRWTKPPAPAQRESYYRTPSCVYAIAAVVALYLLARTLFGRATATLAALLLATSLPAVLYAAEVRPYSLLSLATVLQMATFTAVVRAPHRATAWMAYAAASVAYFLTGIFALFVVGVELAVLAWLALRAPARRPGVLTVVATASVLAVVVAGYLAGTSVGATYPRHVVVEPFATTWQALVFLAADSRALAITFLVAVPFAVRAGARRGAAAIAVAIVASFAALPAIAVVISWKHYYFHGRHVLFLLPLFHLVLAAGSVELLRSIDALGRTALAPWRRTIEGAAIAGLAALLVVPPLRAFVAAPQWFFARTKTLRDIRPVVQAVAARVATLPPDTPYLLVAERDSTANVLLVAYLDWYRLGRRVTLRSPGPGVPIDRTEALLREQHGDPAALQLRQPVGLFFGFRRLLRIVEPSSPVATPVGAVGVVAYKTPLAGAGVHRWMGVSFREGAATDPSPPRS
jgi:hypothetical protein